MPRRRKPESPFKRLNSSPEVIRLVVIMYVRSPLSLRNVDDLLAEPGMDICHETARYWWNRFGPMFAADIKRQRISRMRDFRHWRWHLDEMFVKINGEMHYLGRAVDHEGQVLEGYVTKKLDKSAALNFFKKALKHNGRPTQIVTDGLRSYPAALDELSIEDRQEMGRWKSNRAENSQSPLRLRKLVMQRFWRMKRLQKLASVHADFHNHFNSERNLNDRQIYKTTRSAALAEWQGLMA
ncbi:IS6 family transposase [Erythrobacter ani]|uniref:IS6 family transposase n=1 Tax=Erythrobacter ani TaxID=2827235 RepID=A0ABS6SR64_9SPHN|nr:IS6 family transposase [Erythrobacter ani]MBV7267536.1 IS6 family transposase [Erythrobacter ani]